MALNHTNPGAQPHDSAPGPVALNRTTPGPQDRQYSTAPRLSPPSRNFPWKKAGVTAQALRTDRILYEVEQTSGDVRRICDLFGIAIETALRYSATILAPTNPEDAGHPS